MYNIIKGNKRGLLNFLSLLIFANFFLIFTSHKVLAQVYINNFEENVGNEWSKSSIDKTPNGNLSFLGQFGNETVSLKLKKDTSGNVTISFDLYVINSWDGNDKEFGLDIWKLDIVGGSTLIQTTFSNLEENGIKQSYPNPFGQGNNNAGTGSTMYDTLGYTYFGDSVYHFSFNFNHSAGDVIFNFSAENLQEMGDESWGIDNISVKGAYAEKDDVIEKEPLNSVKIGKLHVSYYEWELNQAILKGNLEIASKELKKLENENNERINNIKEYDRQLELVNIKMASIEEEISSQYQKLNEVENNLKNRKYKRIVSSISNDNKRLYQIVQRIDNVKKNVSFKPDEVLSRLVKESEELTVKISDNKKELNILKEKLGIKEEHQKRLALIKKNEDLYWEFKRQIIDIEHNKSRASSLHGLSLERYTDANKRYDEANIKYYKLQETGSPLITLINNDYYYAQLWTPTVEIKKLDEQVENLKSHLKNLDKIRTNLRNELKEDAWRADYEANQLYYAFFVSGSAQFLVEVADFGYEGYSAFKNGSIIGLAIKTTEKMVSLRVFGLPTYYDAKYDFSDQFAMKYIDGEKIVTKKTIKTATLHLFKILKTKNINSIEKKTFKLLKETKNNLTQVTRFQDLLKEVIDNYSTLIDDQSKLIKESEKAFKASFGGLGKMELGKILGENLLKGLATEAGKMALKKILAEEIEGKQLIDYMHAQYKLSGSARLLLQASNAYWISKDAYESLRGVRNLLIEKYDPDNQMLIEYSNTKTYSEEYEDYHIYISDRNGDSSRASNRDIEVTLGGVKAKRHSNGSLHFIIPAEKVGDIKSDSDGAYLEIKVIK